jgi:uncharacterized protein (DUF608 family)
MNSAPYSLPRRFVGAGLDKIAFPIGGMGSGMFCLTGTGGFSHFSVRHLPSYLTELQMFSAMAIREESGVTGRVLEGPIPDWKPLYSWNKGWHSSGHGCDGRAFGLPRLDRAEFSASVPFATVELEEESLPVKVSIMGWSPFIPGDVDATSLPVGAVEYTFKNRSLRPVELVYSFHLKNFLALSGTSVNAKAEGSVTATPGGFVIRAQGTPEKPEMESACAAWIDDPAVRSDLAWFRGGWYDAATLVWRNIAEGKAVENAAVTEGGPSSGGSLYLPLTLAPNEARTVRLLLAWYTPYSTIREGYPALKEGEKLDVKTDCYRPWYAGKFSGVEEVAALWTKECGRMREASADFAEAFYDTTLPAEVIDAVAANLTILKAPTVLREIGGKFWAWEGTGDETGSCYGTCTHVWNYAQALPHLFPSAERSFRDSEFLVSQNEKGHQDFRTSLPIAPSQHTFHAAADGQLGGILKVFRDWRISGDADWLRGLWPRVKQSLDYCIEAWDPEHGGLLVEAHHNTYDIEFWGADGMCSSFYLAALQAAVRMGRFLGDDVSFYEKLVATGKARFESELFDGEYFIQKIQWKGLRTEPVAAAKVGLFMNYSPEAIALMDREGPKYQYGPGCLSDGILGEWMAWTAGLPPVIAPDKIESHLRAIHRHNFRRDLSKHANPQRPSYAYNHEAGLLLCSWPKGGALSLPFVYSEEVWTGIEYHVASHLISMGHVEEGLEIVRACRDRYDGRLRNPFGEIECGHWYARAMSSYALLQAFTGARYDAVEKKLYVAPCRAGDFRSFLAFDGGYGTVGVRDGQPFFENRSGSLEIREIVFTPARASLPA